MRLVHSQIRGWSNFMDVLNFKCLVDVKYDSTEIHLGGAVPQQGDMEPVKVKGLSSIGFDIANTVTAAAKARSLLQHCRLIRPLPSSVFELAYALALAVFLGGIPLLCMHR